MTHAIRLAIPDTTFVIRCYKTQTIQLSIDARADRRRQKELAAAEINGVKIMIEWFTIVDGLISIILPTILMNMMVMMAIVDMMVMANMQMRSLGMMAWRTDIRMSVGK